MSKFKIWSDEHREHLRSIANNGGCTRGAWDAKPDSIRKISGENSVMAKLTWKEVDEIRASDEPQRTLARRYGVHDNTIKNIRRWNTWKHRPEGEK